MAVRGRYLFEFWKFSPHSTWIGCVPFFRAVGPQIRPRIARRNRIKLMPKNRHTNKNIGQFSMKYQTFYPLRHIRKFNLAILGSMLLVSACASTPAPNEALQAAELAIANAERERVADYAAPELGDARDKLTAARAAINDENMVLAQRLAEQSRVGAELAIAKAEVAKTKVVNDEMKKSTDVMQQEMKRNQGISR
jgi:hypothetical protein